MLNRKLIVSLLIGGVLLVSGIHAVARWLEVAGAVDVAEGIRSEFLTGTAIAVIVALLVLLPDRLDSRPKRRSDNWPFD